MRVVNINKHAEKKINKLGLWSTYEKQRDYFISDPSHPSLDFKHIQTQTYTVKYPSFKIKRGIRVLMFKHDEDNYTVFDAGEFHKKQQRR